jgi:hypothetical protein
MKQAAYLSKNENELNDILASIKTSDEYSRASSILLHAKTNMLTRSEAEDILEKMHAALPDANIVGLSAVELRGKMEKKKTYRLTYAFLKTQMSRYVNMMQMKI